MTDPKEILLTNAELVMLLEGNTLPCKASDGSEVDVRMYTLDEIDITQPLMRRRTGITGAPREAVVQP